MPGAGKVSDAWWAVITGATGIPEDLHLSAAEQKAFDDAKAVLADPATGKVTATYQSYKDYAKAYEKAQQACRCQHREPFDSSKHSHSAI